MLRPQTGRFQQPKRRTLPLGRRNGVIPDGPDILGNAAGDNGLEEVVEAAGVLPGVSTAVRTDRRFGGRLHVERSEEARQGLGRVVAAAEQISATPVRDELW